MILKIFAPKNGDSFVLLTWVKFGLFVILKCAQILGLHLREKLCPREKIAQMAEMLPIWSQSYDF
jgi:hypothetical protein